ncbi:BON domain-containing protein [Paraburkholderia kururiensis]|uniref:BON domain-containing protein n=1 Tax=Paraburkholderia kururiensis TaxID=984307 RepID=UPI00034A49A7|nr:BON domain-containing protein [Paraburkholderia kururiensis]
MKSVNLLKSLGVALCMTIACSAYAQSSDAAAAGGDSSMSAPAAKKATKKADRKLGYTVRKALSKAQGVDVSNITVRSRGGAVTLTGSVPDESQIAKAEEVAKSVPGVTSVTNKLTKVQQ